MSTHTHATPEQLNPDPPVWPVCTVCGTAYVIRRCLSLNEGWRWTWQADCAKPRNTCNGARVVPHDADGPLA